MQCKINGLIIILLIIPFYQPYVMADSPLDYFFRLTIYFPGSYGDEALFIAYNLREIGIDSELKSPWGVSEFFNPLENDDWDLSIFGLNFPSSSPDMRSLYSSSGSFNVFRLQKTIPYQNQSDNMLEEGVELNDFANRIQLYHNWQKLVMDKIIPIFPLWYGLDTFTVWENIEGFNARFGLIESFPYMSYNGLHFGQESLDEFNLAISSQDDFDDCFNGFENNLITEPLLQVGPDKLPLKTGVIQDWEQINENHFKFSLRDNIYWNPSYYMTSNNSTNIPIENLPLLSGLQNTSSNGTDQKLTAKDAVFTLLVNTYLNGFHNSNDYDWLSDCYIDPINELDFHVVIDANLETVEREMFADFWYELEIPILPEFFLNSTEDDTVFTEAGIKIVGLYPGISSSHIWRAFEDSGFGCGKFMPYFKEQYNYGQFKRSQYWFGVGAIDGREGLEPFIEDIKLYLRDDQVQLVMMENGKIDYSEIYLSIEDVDCSQPCPYKVQTKERDRMLLLAFNLQRDYIGGGNNSIWIEEQGKENHTKALAVRKAICFAIDRDEINQVKYGGNLISSDSIIPPSKGAYYNENASNYENNLDFAREWMKAAGYNVEDLIYPGNLKGFGFFIGVFIGGLAAIVLLALKISKRFRNKILYGY
jgi:ABC-type transport system substrate-binding protein